MTNHDLHTYLPLPFTTIIQGPPVPAAGGKPPAPCDSQAPVAHDTRDPQQFTILVTEIGSNTRYFIVMIDN